MFATIAVLASAIHVASVPAAAAPAFFVGTDENALFSGNSQQVASVARTLGLRSVRITLTWQPGQTQVPAAAQLTPADVCRLFGLSLQATRTIARLLRDKRALTGEAADGISGAIAQALDELSTEWGIDL